MSCGEFHRRALAAICDVLPDIDGSLPTLLAEADKTARIKSTINISQPIQRGIVILVAAPAQRKKRPGSDGNALFRFETQEVGARRHAGEKQAVTVEQIDIRHGPRLMILRAMPN